MSNFRPKAYSEEVFNDICRLIVGGMTLNKITENPRYPSKDTFYNWLHEDEDGERLRRYEIARSLQADTWADEAIDIADDGSNDWVLRYNPRTDEDEMVVDKEHVMRSELRIKTRKWMCGVWKPRRYGDKTQVEISGDPNKPVTTVHRIEIVGPGEAAAIEHKPQKAIDERPSFLKPKADALDFEG